jgi:hypothetical protein
MLIDSENLSKVRKHIQQLRSSRQTRCYLYSKAATTKFGDIGFNYKALYGTSNHFQSTFSHQCSGMNSREHNEVTSNSQ